jgi:hypothetical protein
LPDALLRLAELPDPLAYLPLYSLRSLLGLPQLASDVGKLLILLLKFSSQRVALFNEQLPQLSDLGKPLEVLGDASFLPGPSRYVGGLPRLCRFLGLVDARGDCRARLLSHDGLE